MDNLNSTWKELLEKYIDNTCTKEELNQILKMIENEEDADALSQMLKEFWVKSKSAHSSTELDIEARFSLLMKEAKQEAPVYSIQSNPRKNKWKMYYAAAAIIICMLSVGAYFLLKPEYQNQIRSVQNIKIDKNDVNPGGNKAVLTLADGSSIILDSTLNGTLTTQGNIKIIKLNGMLSYNTLKNKTPEVLYNTITTPRGGQYQLVLTDGTKVWLNAASSLRYPSNFVGKERKVELTGEAYFEVAHISSSRGGGREEAAMPFKVKVNGMEVEVLGTHFNINSYEDESAIRTTLLEGSIKINKHGNSSLLKPGQQALLNKQGEIKIINDADVEEAIAWKDEKFQFDKADIHAVMRQIARWYDVEVEYKGAITSHFGGTISRNVNLSQVLNMLHLTGEVTFEIKDRKVVVMP